MLRGSVPPDGKWDMAEKREPDESEKDRGKPEGGRSGRPSKADILVTILTTVTAIATCVEQLAR